MCPIKPFYQLAHADSSIGISHSIVWLMPRFSAAAEKLFPHGNVILPPWERVVPSVGNRAKLRFRKGRAQLKEFFMQEGVLACRIVVYEYLMTEAGY